MDDKKSLTYISLGILIIFLLLVGGVYYWVTKKSGGGLVFPSGVNYLSPNQPTPAVPQYDYAKLAASTDLLTLKGQTYAYSFQYPRGLNAIIFAKDPNDSVTFKTSALPAEQNLMLLVERISERDKSYVGKYEDFVRDYWKFFGGLKGSKDLTPFTNNQGLVGFKVNYVTKGNVVTSDNYFFEIPGDTDHMLHLNNIFPKEGEAVFLRILNSLSYKK